MCLLRHTFTGSWGSKFMPNSEELQSFFVLRTFAGPQTHTCIHIALLSPLGNLWKVTLATLELFLQFKTAQYFILWSRSLSCHCCCILDQLLPLYSENSRKIFLRSCNWECTQPERPCTLKNPSRRGWQISWGRLLLNNLLDQPPHKGTRAWDSFLLIPFRLGDKTEN